MSTMELLKKLPREVQVVLGGALLYLIFSFLDWQQVSFAGISAGINEWHGVGVIAGLLVIALLVWEVVRFLGLKVELGPLTPGLVSVGLALLLLLFTVITFLSHNEARHWPSWLGLILSVVIALAAFSRAKAEGVEMPDLKAMASANAPAAPAAPPAAPEAPADESAPDASQSQPTS